MSRDDKRCLLGQDPVSCGLKPRDERVLDDPAAKRIQSQAGAAPRSTHGKDSAVWCRHRFTR